MAVKELDRFDLSSIKRTLGDMHHSLIGKWIDWWIEGGKDKRIAWSEPPCLLNRNRSDIMFLECLQEDTFYPVGIAEVENDEKNWDEKIETMAEYARNIDSIDFLILSTWTYSEVALDKRMRSRAERLLRLLVDKASEATKDAEFKLIICLILYSKDELSFHVRNIPWKYKSGGYTRRLPSEVQWFLAQKGNVSFWKNGSWKLLPNDFT